MCDAPGVDLAVRTWLSSRVSTVEQLDQLIQMMTAKDLEIVEKKVRLSERRAELARKVVYDLPEIAFSVGEPQRDLFGGDEA